MSRKNPQFQYIDGTYKKHNPTWHQEDAKWKANHIKTMLSDNNITPQTIAEIGCGSGEILNRLQKQLDKNIEYFGYDISPDAIKIAKPKKNSKLHFQKKDLININQQFDLILCIDVFEHIPDYKTFLKTLRQSATQFIFHIPLDLSIQSELRKTPLIKARQEVGHLHFFTKKTALKTLKEAGYTIKDVFYTSAQTELPAKSLLSALAKYPRKILFKIAPDFTVRVLGGYSLMVLCE